MSPGEGFPLAVGGHAVPVREGATELDLDADASHAGPGTRDRERPFYNPAMQTNRDLSVRLVQAWATRRGRQLDVADVLAGAGARSLRLANEVDADIVVHANDGDPNAIAAIEAGRQRLGTGPERLTTTHGAAHSFLAGRRFDVIDIDPYGSPMPFLDGAMNAVRHDGLVCITATDTAALSGTYPRVCRRRYGAWHGLHAQPWRAEVGLRILAGAAIRSAGRFDRAATPVLSISRGHWMRVVLHVTESRKAADALARGLGIAVSDHGLGRMAATDGHGEARVLEPDEAARRGDWAGPVWTGALHDRPLLDAMAGMDGAVHARTERFLQVAQDEAAAPPFWLHMGRIRAHLHADPPRMGLLKDALAAAGHAAAPTHMDPEGIRTDAGWAAVSDALAAAKQE